MKEELLTVAEAAKRARISGRTMRLWINVGRVPASRIGRAWLIKWSDIEKAMETNRKAVAK